MIIHTNSKLKNGFEYNIIATSKKQQAKNNKDVMQAHSIFLFFCRLLGRKGMKL